MEAADGAHYMLRRNLPLWTPAATIADTISFCLDVGIKEIIWKVDPEAFNHGFTTHDFIRKHVPWLEDARDRQAKHGIIFSINPWVTMMHAGRCRYAAGPPEGFHWRVQPDGSEALERACPLSPGWRDWFLEAYRIYASTFPDKLWLEDDFKTFAHNACALGCFCPAHLEQFAEHIGERLTREQLAERLVQPGAPDPIRAQWLDFQGQILVDVCKELERVVHAVSPQTRLGQMQSWSSDGRWWAEALLALAGPHRPLARTSLAPYQECEPSGFMPDRFDIMKETECLAPNTENCPELENSPYTPYSKSMSTTRLQIVLAQLLGNRAITMNLFDMVGRPTGEYPRVGRMLKDLKPRLDAIARTAGPGGIPRGVSVPFDKRYADSVTAAPGEGFDAFRFDGEGWFESLQGSGIPVFFNAASSVSAVTGESCRSMREDEVIALLSQGLLLDGSAAAVLEELGYGEHIGVSLGDRIERYDVLLCAERDDDADSTAGTEDDPVYMNLRYVAHPGQGRLYPLSPSPGARVTSTFVDPDHVSVMPGMVLFENSLGGRVAVYPFDFSEGSTFCFMNWSRRVQLQRIVRWLARDEVALFVDGGAWMVPFRRDYAEHTLIAVLNPESDAWDWLRLTLAWGGANAPAFEILEDNGDFVTAVPACLERNGTNVKARFSRGVPAHGFEVFRVTPAG